jgi:hypothetical protein
MNKIAGPFKTAHRPALVVGTLVAVSLAAAACGGGSSPAATKTSAPSTTAAAAKGTTPTTSGTTATSGAGTGRSGGAASFASAASGTIASILGQSLEVQGSSGQTTVDLTAKTAITATVPVRLSDITKGTCISATGTKGTGGKVDATLVTIEPSVKGSCTERGGFPGGGARGGPGGTFTSRPPGSVPSTRFKVPTNVAEAFGKVTSVSGSTIVIQGISFAAFGRPTSSTSASAPTTLPKTSPETVVVSSKTKYSKTERVTYHALKVGECATAFGSTNDIGVVTATRLTVTQPVGGSCTTGVGGFRGGFVGGSSSGGPAGTTS